MSVLRKIGGFLYFTTLSLGCQRYPEEQATAAVNGQELFYVTRGPVDGKPVLLIHGNGGSHKSLRTQAMQLARAGYRVYSPDSRGQGVNAPLSEYHYADMAEDMYLFVKEVIKEQKVAVYGWSDGGIIALMMEMAHPGFCGPMAVSGANLTPDCGPGFEEFKAWILSEGTPIALMMLEEPDIKQEELAVIQCPVLVTAGDKDLISVEHTQMIADGIPDSELVIFKNATHSSYIKKNPRMGRRLLEFLQKWGY